jgi:hypothetical protein
MYDTICHGKRSQRRYIDDLEKMLFGSGQNKNTSSDNTNYRESIFISNYSRSRGE